MVTRISARRKECSGPCETVRVDRRDVLVQETCDVGIDKLA